VDRDPFRVRAERIATIHRRIKTFFTPRKG
jgi:hypothetical protein